MYIYAGGKAYNIDQKGGRLLVFSGGYIHSAVVSNGYLNLAAGASATAVQVLHPSFLLADYDSNSVISITVIGVHFYVGDGKMNNLFVWNNRNMVVRNGWVASNTTLLTNYTDFGVGSMTIERGGHAFETKIAYGTLIVSAGGYAEGIIQNEGTQIVMEGGNIESAIIQGGVLNLHAGASATHINISGNGFMTADYTAATRITGTSNGTLIRCGNREMSNLTVWDNRYMRVDYGWTSFNTVLDTKQEDSSVASMFVDSGGRATETTISHGILYVNREGYADNTTLLNGSLFVRSGGVADGGIIRGGVMHVTKGGIIKGFELSSSGEIILSSGAEAQDLVISNGNLKLTTGTVVTNTSVCAGGNFIISRGNVASDTQVLAGGTATFINKGIADGGVVEAGGSLVFSSGAIVRGAFDATGLVTVKAGTVISDVSFNFNLVGLEGGNTAILNSMELLSAESYSIVVSTAQSRGSYILANGADSFSDTITIRGQNGLLIGTIAVGKTLKAGKCSYTLLRNNVTLSLVISDIAVSNSTPRYDIDGNGVSDVMFQYKVDHQIGFWMNGTNTWEGQGLPEPAEWEVVGAYDMNANGKADVVMLGNVTVNGVKGAYVGYRKDGDMSTWENISFLNNPDNIQWNVKIGNMTGNAGKNSIVWHAAELGAVGVWTDGTDNWVSISGGFDKNWTMLGTGDFNGDGKDEILFQNGTNFYTTDINSNFASLGGFGAGWEVRAIGDFSGDGKDDLVLFHKDTGSVVKLENGQASSYASLGQLDANDWFIVGAGDYNGDGKDDLLVRQYSTGMLGYYANGDFSKWNEMGRGVDMNWAVIA